MFCWIYCLATTGGSTSLLNFNITSGTSFFCCIFISSSLLFFGVEWYVHAVYVSKYELHVVEDKRPYYIQDTRYKIFY